MRSLLAAFALVLAGCGSLLGGRCDEGWVPSAGACDGGIPADSTSSDAAAMDVPDGAIGVEAGAPDAATDATGSDAVSDVVCASPRTRCGARCVDLGSSRTDCGACDRPCASGQLCVIGVCSDLCAPPLMICDGLCIDVQTDPNNCGGCGVICPTGICNGGRCRDARAGHLVLIGHDFQATRPEQGRVLGNAVFLSTAASPRLVKFTAWTLASSATNADAAIAQVAGRRPYVAMNIDNADALAGVLSVDQSDVVLIEHQRAATDEQIAALARRIAAPAAGYVRAGGVLIVLDGEGSGSGTWPLAVASGLVAITRHQVVTGGEADVVNGADAVAVGLPVAYRAEQGSVVFLGTSGNGDVLRASGLPLVIHRVVFGG